MDRKSALLVVDMQNDFLPGGALPVKEGDTLLPRVQAYVARFVGQGLPIYASRDWHPAESEHFAAQGGDWPVHCVRDTEGAAFSSELDLSAATVISKGVQPDEEGYTAFDGHDAAGKDLESLLSEAGVTRLYVCGLALDYCVKASTLGALERGLTAILLIDATRAVNVDIHDGELAIEEMVRAGADLATIEHI